MYQTDDTRRGTPFGAAASGAFEAAQASPAKPCRASAECGCAAHAGNATGSTSGAIAELENIHLMLVAVQDRLAQAVGGPSARSPVELQQCLADLGLLLAAIADAASQHRQTVADLERTVAKEHADMTRIGMGERPARDPARRYALTATADRDLFYEERP